MHPFEKYRYLINIHSILRKVNMPGVSPGEQASCIKGVWTIWSEVAIWVSICSLSDGRTQVSFLLRYCHLQWSAAKVVLSEMRVHKSRGHLSDFTLYLWGTNHFWVSPRPDNGTNSAFEDPQRFDQSGLCLISRLCLDWHHYWEVSFSKSTCSFALGPS